MDDKNNIKSQVQRRMREDKKHSFSMDNRNKMALSGILNVESFNEQEIVLETELGILAIKGSDLHMSKLNLETGDLMIDGSIDSCIYSEKQDLKAKGAGILSKLFR